MKKLELRDIIYIIIIISLLILLVAMQVDKNINILSHSDWVTIFIGMLTFIGTMVLGIIAIYQNVKDHGINDRLLKIEENKNKTYLIIKNGNILAFPINDEIWSNEKYAIDLSKSIIINATNDANNGILINPEIDFIGDKPIKSIKVDIVRIMQKNIKTKESKEVILIKINKESSVNFVNLNNECKGYISLPIVNASNYIDENNLLEINLYITTTNVFDVSIEYLLQFTLSNIKQNKNNFTCYHLISRIVTEIK